MIQRIKEREIELYLKQFPVVAIVGPRQCGKTTLAKRLSKSTKLAPLYFDLESPSDNTRFDEPEFFLMSISSGRVIIDEVQRRPELFSLLRSLVDRKKKKGNYLLLGSASPDLVKGVSETLAGRIAYIELTPFNLLEVYKAERDLYTHWFRGGFPAAWKARSADQWHAWIGNFFRTFIERDLNTLFGVTFSPALMFRLWRMMDHHHGSVWNAELFAKGLDISPTTVNKYIDYLEGAYMLRKIPAYFTNAKKRITKSPKVYIRDSGVLHYLLDIHKASDLVFHPSVGFSWEGYAIEQILQLIPYNIRAFHYRTHDGSEMDLVLVKGIKVICCIELKTTNSPRLSRGFYESLTDLNCKGSFVVTPAQPVEYKMSEDTIVCGLQVFLDKYIPRVIKL